MKSNDEVRGIDREEPLGKDTLRRERRMKEKKVCKDDVMG